MDESTQFPIQDASSLKEPYCFHCLNVPATKLLRCSRCQVAWYCNSQCQKEHYAVKHRPLCLRIAKAKKRVEREEVKLRSTPIRPFIGTQTVFEADIGNFWGLEQTIAYMQASCDLLKAHWDAANDSEVKELWEKTLFYSLEHLRLGAVDHMGARLRVPFILLFLNRDDDACTFIQYWSRPPETVLDSDAIYDTHFNSKEGDWIYPCVPNIRYSDISDQIMDSNDFQAVELPFLVALAIIKLRVVAEHEAISQSLELAFEGTAGQRIQEVQSTVKDMLLPNIDMESQRRQLQRVLDAIHLHNPSMLPAIINPTPITEQPRPDIATLGHPSEVYDSLLFSRRCFVQVPGALDMLKERFGSNPIYNSNMTIL